MKEKFSTIDLFSVLQDLQQRLVGMRVANVYDIDQKTYLIKLARPDEKAMLLFESGCRLHTTEFEWPKNMQPSGFSMKLRKHLRTRRLISITQLGVDRVVDLQFGANEAAYHVILELYDRGNVILTDYAYTILSLLRTRTDKDADVRFAVRETFSQDTIKQEHPSPSIEMVRSILAGAKPGDQLKHVLNPHFVYGSALLSHSLLGGGFSENAKVGSGFDPESDVAKVMAALDEADILFRRLRDEPSKGYIIQKRHVQPQAEPAATSEGVEDIYTNVEYHPMLFRQHQTLPYKEFETLTKAVDEFYSAKTSQKQDIKSLQMQKSAVKKLENFRMDHQRRIDTLQKKQEEDVHKAQLIELNVDLIDRATLVIRSAIANAMDWGDIELLVKDAQGRGDPVAMAIHSLKLKSNEITLILRDPTEEEEEISQVEEGEDVGRRQVKKQKKKGDRGTKVDIDLGLSVYANARRYYDHRRQAARKEQKTLDASEKALKSAEKKTKKTLKEVSTITKIQKARKVHWFEKFFWFISSENYLVIGGRDQQQNELVVKRYLNEGDVYVHADLHGATSVVIKNHSGGPIPPRTLTEAGTMAVCYSTAWEAHIITSAWWVYHHQVSKTAPTGEYLTTGSFMIRGKKNFLPPCQLSLGFGFLFRVDDSCIVNHLHERVVRATDDDEASVLSEAASEVTLPEMLDEEGLGGEEGSGSEQEKDGPPVSEDEEEEEAELTFPDTTIQLHHVAGEKYELQRGVSTTSSQLDETEQPDTTALEDGDNLSHKEEEERRHQHISAKQRRELRKQAKQQAAGNSGSDQQAQPAAKSSKKQVHQSPQPMEQPTVKRGQKAKQKKMQEKYADQDEEERRLRMEILASAGPAKEQKSKKAKKGKKSRSADPTQPTNQKYKYYKKEKEKTLPTLVEPDHKQKPPSLNIVSVAEVDHLSDKMEKSNVLENKTCAKEPVDGAQGDLVALVTEERPRMELNDGELKKLVSVVEDLEERAAASGLELTDNASSKDTDMAVEDVQAISRQSGHVQVKLHTQHVHEVSESRTLTTAENDGQMAGPLLEDLEPLQEARAQESIQEEKDESDDEEKRALLAEENIQQLEDAEKEQLSVLDSFTGCPLPEDILLYSIPVCAPYTAVLNYKYKVKLVPGTSRRGKAAKAALHRFLQSKEATQREKDLLKSTKDTDLSRYIPGKVKMSLPQAYKQHHR